MEINEVVPSECHPITLAGRPHIKDDHNVTQEIRHWGFLETYSQQWSLLDYLSKQVLPNVGFDGYKQAQLELIMFASQ